MSEENQDNPVGQTASEYMNPGGFDISMPDIPIPEPEEEQVAEKEIKDEKPDVYIAVQDIWGVDFAINKPWFSKINSIIWTTLDSLPILPTAVEKASQIKHYWIWSDFATKALHELGHKHVKTVHGALDDTEFYKLSDSKKADLRKRFNIHLYFCNCPHHNEYHTRKYKVF